MLRIFSRRWRSSMIWVLSPLPRRYVGRSDVWGQGSAARSSPADQKAPRRPHAPTGRGSRVGGRGSDERRNRRAPLRVAENRRPPRVGPSHKARGGDATGSCGNREGRRIGVRAGISLPLIPIPPPEPQSTDSSIRITAKTLSRRTVVETKTGRAGGPLAARSRRRESGTCHRGGLCR